MVMVQYVWHPVPLAFLQRLIGPLKTEWLRGWLIPMRWWFRKFPTRCWGPYSQGAEDDMRVLERMKQLISLFTKQIVTLEREIFICHLDLLGESQCLQLRGPPHDHQVRHGAGRLVSCIK